MKTLCIQCGAAFQRERNEKWKKLCLDCWRAKQPKKAEELATLTRELEQWRTRAHLAELRLQLGTGGQSAQFDTEELKALRRLCHPDRHGGSETATRLTQKINAMLSP